MARTAAHEMFDRDAASLGLGMELVEAGNGAAVVRMPVTEVMTNGHGMAHTAGIGGKGSMALGYGPVRLLSRLGPVNCLPGWSRKWKAERLLSFSAMRR